LRLQLPEQFNFPSLSFLSFTSEIANTKSATTAHIKDAIEALVYAIAVLTSLSLKSLPSTCQQQLYYL